MSHLDRRQFLGASVAAVALSFVAASLPAAAQNRRRGGYAVVRTDAQWRAMLSADAFAVLRRQGTERPGSSPLNNEHRRGTFACAGCANPAFSSTTKFDSGTGWPSFYRALPGGVGTTTDRSLGAVRTEVHCARCGGHLGHVFNDGPQPTGLRYCMNGVAMTFRPG